MDYDFSKLSLALSQLEKINSVDIFNNLSPALKAASQHFDTYKKLIQNSTAMQTTLKTLSDVLQSSSYRDLVASSGISVLSAMTKNLSSLNIVSLSKTALETLNDSSSFPEEDFVTFDESPIKEWNIPDTIAIPVGNNRIRMKTDIFITILSGIIVPILLWIAGLIVDLHDAHAKAQTESQRLEIEQERNNLIRENNQLFNQCIELLISTDASSSSETDRIEYLKEYFPKPDFAPITSDLTPDNPQESHNSNPE